MFDAKARETATSSLDAGFHDELEPIQTVFLYLPFEHSEEPADQERSVALFEELDYLDSGGESFGGGGTA